MGPALRLAKTTLARMSLNHVLQQVESRLRRHNLPVKLTLWTGHEYIAGTPVKTELVVRKRRALLTLANPTLGNLARSYVEQDIDLAGSMHDIIRLGESLCDVPHRPVVKTGVFPIWPRHSKSADREAISYHYDLSNDFYKLWLDRELVYSCAYFRSGNDTLDLAQQQKLDYICRKLKLEGNERFLDIGCGWGALIMWAARHHGVQATGITLSRNQYEYAAAQIRARGLQDRCQVHLMDYRDLPESEQYDKIASVGMFEHVGRKNLPLYFGKIYRLLKPGGLMMNHGITSMSLYGVGLGDDVSDFIDRYVFPSGELAHVSRVIETMSGQKLECRDAECLRPHYAKTLWHWVDHLEAKKQEAIAFVGEKKYRIWQVYMAGSAWAFERGWLSIYQLLAGKLLADGRLPHPLTRDYVYTAPDPAAFTS